MIPPQASQKLSIISPYTLKSEEVVSEARASFARVVRSRWSSTSTPARLHSLASTLTCGFNSIHPSALMAMIPSLVAGAIGAGWKPQEGTLSDPASSDPSKSSVQLFSGATAVHPDTDVSPLSFQLLFAQLKLTVSSFVSDLRPTRDAVQCNREPGALAASESGER